MKKDVLIVPGNDLTSYIKLTQLISPPLGVLAIGSYLMKHGIPVEIIDVQMDFGFGRTCTSEHLVSQRVAQYLLTQADDIAWIGISQLSNFFGGIDLARKIHRVLPGVPIIFGGYFPSSNYRTLLKKYTFITAIVRGDGEIAALKISRSLNQDQSFLSEQTPNLAWLDNDEVLTAPVKPLLINDLPIMDFRLLRNPKNYQIISMMTSRGCPFRCNYCLESSMRSYGVYAPEWIDRQLKHLEAVMPNNYIFIYDATFGIGRKRTLNLCRVLNKHRFTYGVESRVDVIRPDLIPLLHKSGVKTIYWGIESASAATLLRMNKVRSLNSAQGYIEYALKVLETCFENGVIPSIGFMLSFPGDSEDDYQINLAFAKEIKSLYNRISAKTGIRTGFIFYVMNTKIYDGSPLAQCVGKKFPEAILRSEPFIGERAVISSSPGVDLSTARHFQNEIVNQAVFTPLTLELMSNCLSFSLEAFLEAYPELTDQQGVTIFGDSFQRFSQAFTPASMLINHDKPKDMRLYQLIYRPKSPNVQRDGVD